MKLVILESPYAGDVEANIAYARKCIRHSLILGESPIASHLLYTQDGILDDNHFAERKLGIDSGHAWIKVADMMVVYGDRGVSGGMQIGMEKARAAGLKVVYRSIE